MRKRSSTIHAKNENEYKEIMSQRRSLKKKTLKSKFSTQIFPNDNHSNNNISCSAIYIMNLKENTLEEQEKQEEEELLINLHNLNTFYKDKDKKEFLTSLANLSKSSLSSFYLTEKKEKNFKKKRHFSYNSIDSIEDELHDYMSEASTNDSHLESLIMQNLELYEDVLKIMVIGEKYTGKSCLISKLISTPHSSYIPTKNLEIHSKLLKILGKYIKVEFFDTCSKVLNDPLISIYYKLSHGFILVCNNLDFNSIKFVEIQIDKIQNLSCEKKIILICNEKKKSTELNNEELETYKICLEYMRRIEEKYKIRFRHINISGMTIDSPCIEKFLQMILIKKDKSYKNGKVKKQIHVRKDKNLPLNKTNRMNSASFFGDVEKKFYLNKNKEGDNS